MISIEEEITNLAFLTLEKRHLKRDMVNAVVYRLLGRKQSLGCDVKLTTSLTTSNHLGSLGDLDRSQVPVHLHTSSQLGNRHSFPFKRHFRACIANLK